MENPVSPKLTSGTRIPKAPSIASPTKPAKLQSPVSETKLPTIKQTTRKSKAQTVQPLPSPLSSPNNPTKTLIQSIPGTGTKLRRANSSMCNPNSTQIGESKFLRRSKSSLSESKRPKSQTLPIGTKLPKLQPNTGSGETTKHLKKGALKLPEIEAAVVTRENTNRKLPKMLGESKLPRVQSLYLPLKELNSGGSRTAATAAVGSPTADHRKEPLGKLDEIEILSAEDSVTMDTEIVKTHTTTIIAPKVTKKTDSRLLKSVGSVTKPKVLAPILATKLPKATTATQAQATMSPKPHVANNPQTPATKISPMTNNAGKKIPKAQLSLTGLKATKTSESKLPKSPTTPDESKLPKAIATGSKPDVRRQLPVTRR